MDAFYAAITLAFVGGAAITIIGIKMKARKRRADEAFSQEFEQVSDAVFAELDAKKDELLKLYEMIGERSQRKIDVFVGEPEKPNPKPVPSPFVSRAIALKNSGFSTADVARELGIGQGEVKLMTNLYGDADA